MSYEGGEAMVEERTDGDSIELVATKNQRTTFECPQTAGREDSHRNP